MSEPFLLIQNPAEPAQLIVLCHAAGADAASMRPLGELLRESFPQAVIVSLLAPRLVVTETVAPPAFAWFDVTDLNEDERPERVAQALPALQRAVHDWQQRCGVSAEATALVGWSQGAEMLLEASKHQPMLASRLVAIGGRFTTLPEAPPPVTTLHLLHGKLDVQTPYAHTISAAHRLRDLGCDFTAEVVPFVDHALHPELMQRAVTKLSTHIAHHLWNAAQAAAPAVPGQPEID